MSVRLIVSLCVSGSVCMNLKISLTAEMTWFYFTEKLPIVPGKVYNCFDRILIVWFIKLIVQTFKPRIVMYKRVILSIIIILLAIVLTL